MADLQLKISAETQNASAAFSSLAQSSDTLQKKIGKLNNEIVQGKTDKFIEDQKLAAVAAAAAGKSTDNLTKSQAAYQRQIQSLVKQGVDPQNEAIQKLQKEYEELAKDIAKTEDKTEKYAKAAKAGATALKTITVAATAAAAGIGAAVTATANAGDEFYTTGKMVGLTAEQLQELKYAAGQSGVEYNTLVTSFQKLNKNIGDVKNGTGTLTTALKGNNDELLAQLQNVNSNDEAFNILMQAINAAPSEFDRATIAQAAFGKSGQALIPMALEGSEAISALRDEAREYGIISNESAEAGDKYNDTMAKLQQALDGARNALGETFLPIFTEFIEKAAGAAVKVSDFIRGIDDLPRKLELIGIALLGVAAGLAAFVGVNKIMEMARGFSAMFAALSANPVALIAAGVAALIVGLVALYKNWDTVQTYLQQGVARLQYAFLWFSSKVKETFTVAVNGVKIAFISLGQVIVEKVLGAVAKLLDVMGKLPFVGEMFQSAAASVRGFAGSFAAVTNAAKAESAAAIQAAKAQQDQYEADLNANLGRIDREAQARRAAIEARKEEDAADREEAIALADTRNAEDLARAAEQAAALGAVSVDDETKIAQAQATADEMVAIEENANSAIKKSNEELAAAERKILEERLGAVTTFTSGFVDLLALASDESRGAAIASKMLASAEAAINSYLAFTQVIASPDLTPGFKLIKAAGVLAAGLAQQAKIIGTPLPSAETGGSFMVPDSGSVDSRLVRINPGERVDVTPRGEDTAGGSYTFNLILDGETLAQAINNQARSGNLYTLALAGNY